MTDDPVSPVEQDINDPALQDQSPDLPAPVTGNDDTDDTEAPTEPADTGEVDPEGEADG